MKKNLLKLLALLTVIAGVFLFTNQETNNNTVKKIKSTNSKHASLEMKKGRAEYFINLLADPATKSIPRNIRSRELQFAKQLPVNNRLFKAAGKISYNWVEAGPDDVGGRTRALAIDKDNKYILAGGVSGGVWKSTDKGQSWKLKNSAEQTLSVTSLAQDPRPGFTNIWYYSSGEYSGNSASASGAYFTGDGFFKSTDHGETWTQIKADNNITQFSSLYDYVSKVVVAEDGSVYLATSAFGIWKSTDGGNSFNLILGGTTEAPSLHVYSDIEIATDGTLVAVLSEEDWNSEIQSISPGVYKSTDGGASWTNITPPTFPSVHSRSVLAVAPSNPDKVYVYTDTGIEVDEIPDVRFHLISISTGASEDRSANLPTATVDYPKWSINPQQNYNMVLKVKPDDENFVVIGGTCLVRSFNAFAKKDSIVTESYIGGYHYQGSGDYKNHHPDQHAFVFDPDDPKKVWSGHDGGLSYAADITYKDSQFEWTDMNNGYNVTQFYSFALPPAAGDNRMVGGTQDNGSPWFSFDGTKPSSSLDVSTGDGAYCFWGTKDLLVSAQNGKLLRIGIEDSDPGSIFVDPTGIDFGAVHPLGATGQLFIHPYTTDPNDVNFLYYPSGTEYWRNNMLRSIVYGDWDGTEVGYAKIENMTLSGTNQYSAIAVSDSNDCHVVYLGSSGDAGPVLYRVDSATTSISFAHQTNLPVVDNNGQPANGWLHQIAVNPHNSDEIIVLCSNYNIMGTFYSNDGGLTLLPIEGNLTGNAQNPGPSIRSATIVPTSEGQVYFLGTSIGLFSTTELDGDNTVWTQEAPDLIGNVVVAYLTSRSKDGKVGVATHGRGAFVGTLDATVGMTEENNKPVDFVLEQNYPNPFNPTTTINYNIATAADVSLKIFDVKGELVKELVKGMKNAGSHSVTWNSRNSTGQKVASGIYFYTLESGNYIETRKMILLK